MNRALVVAVLGLCAVGTAVGAQASEPPGQPTQVKRSTVVSYDPSTIAARFVDPVPAPTDPGGPLNPKDVDFPLFDGRVVHFVGRAAELHHVSGQDYISWSGAEYNSAGAQTGWGAFTLLHIAEGWELSGSLQPSGSNYAWNVVPAGVGRYELREMEVVAATTTTVTQARTKFARTGRDEVPLAVLGVALLAVGRALVRSSRPTRPTR